MKVQVRFLKTGDVIGTGEEVISVAVGARTPAGKREVTLFDPRNSSARVKVWNASTVISGVKRHGTQ
jgi:hypothetical protein